MKTLEQISSRTVFVRTFIRGEQRRVMAAGAAVHD